MPAALALFDFSMRFAASKEARDIFFYRGASLRLTPKVSTPMSSIGWVTSTTSLAVDVVHVRLLEPVAVVEVVPCLGAPTGCTSPCPSRGPTTLPEPRRPPPCGSPAMPGLGCSTLGVLITPARSACTTCCSCPSALPDPAAVAATAAVPATMAPARIALSSAAVTAGDLELGPVETGARMRAPLTGLTAPQHVQQRMPTAKLIQVGRRLGAE